MIGPRQFRGWRRWANNQTSRDWYLPVLIGLIRASESERRGYLPITPDEIRQMTVSQAQQMRAVAAKMEALRG